MKVVAIIGLVVAIIGIVLIIMILKYNRIQLLLIKLDKGENNINNALEKKYHILLRFIDILKKNININEEDFEEYKLLNFKMPINKLTKKIDKMDNLINKYLDDNEKLLKDDSIVNITKELIDVNVSINGCKKYYNDNLVIYNHLCNAFPSNIIYKIFGYKEKEFLNEDVEEHFKILDDNNE